MPERDLPPVLHAGLPRFDPKAAVARAVAGHTHALNGLSLTPWCPNCGAPECHPTADQRILIRGYKVDLWSHCLVCASAAGPGGYDETLTWRGPLTDAQGNVGWFDDGGAGAAAIVKRPSLQGGT